MPDAAVQPPFDVPRAHRWFAVEANNLGWDLVELADRSPADTERMLHAAHAAWFHWTTVGTPLNRLRAEVLLATAYHSAGLTEPAVAHAERGLALLPGVDDVTLFDVATVFAAAAAALSRTDRQDEARSLRQQALAAADQFDNPADRAVFDKFYPSITQG